MLAETIKSLTPRLKVSYHKPKIENVVFRLHYKATVTVLMVFVFLVCAKEYFGEYIRCISDKESVPIKAMENYCFCMATFTIVRNYNENLLRKESLPHPGVGPQYDGDEILHHTYYQWVPFVLFLQSVCFYLPHAIWKNQEGGRIKALVEGLKYARLSLSDQDMTVQKIVVPSKNNLKEKIDIIKKNIILRLKMSQNWSIALVSMEIANLLNVILQVWLTNKFLNGSFLDLGPRFLRFRKWEGTVNPLEFIFPKVTKCTFRKYGPSGTIQNHDALCVMALNILYEKIYLVLWFWLLFLFIASALAVIWRVVCFFLYRRSLKFNEMLFRQVSGNKFNPYNVKQVVNGCQYGDWLFLYYLGKNMQGFVFKALFVSLAEEFEKHNTLHNENRGQAKNGLGTPKLHYNDETLPLKIDKMETKGDPPI